jgi:hypothetical protein
MRQKISLAALILFISAPAFAQEWVEFVSREDGFGVTFPAQPKVAQTTFKSQFGADLPARTYSAESGQSRFLVTVVDYANIEKTLAEKAKSCPPGAETCRGGGSSTGPGYSWADRAGAVIYVTWQFMQRDAKVTYLGWNNVDLVEGHMLSLVNSRDKSLTQAAIYMHENRLYILEGTVPEGYPEPGFFQQSIRWIDPNGNGIRYQTLYHNGFPKPPVGRGGQAPQGQGQDGRGGNAGPPGQAR